MDRVEKPGKNAWRPFPHAPYNTCSDEEYRKLVRIHRQMAGHHPFEPHIIRIDIMEQLR